MKGKVVTLQADSWAQQTKPSPSVPYPSLLDPVSLGPVFSVDVSHHMVALPVPDSVGRVIFLPNSCNPSPRIRAQGRRSPLPLLLQPLQPRGQVSSTGRAGSAQPELHPVGRWLCSYRKIKVLSPNNRGGYKLAPNCRRHQYDLQGQGQADPDPILIALKPWTNVFIFTTLKQRCNYSLCSWIKQCVEEFPLWCSRNKSD